MHFQTTDLPPAVGPDNQRWVVCLCADWCGLCRDYGAVFSRVAAERAASGLSGQFIWLDVEDQADLVGDMDVETFPTVLVMDASGIQFLGSLTPQPATLQRLLASLDGDGVKPSAHTGDTRHLLLALPQLSAHRLGS